MPAKYSLTLYVLGSSPASQSALRHLWELIAQQTTSTFQLQVIDVVKHPQLAEDGKILAIPTLIKKLPRPIRKIIGDLSKAEAVLFGLDLMEPPRDTAKVVHKRAWRRVDDGERSGPVDTISGGTAYLFVSSDFQVSFCLAAHELFCQAVKEFVDMCRVPAVETEGIFVEIPS